MSRARWIALPGVLGACLAVGCGNEGGGTTGGECAPAVANAVPSGEPGSQVWAASYGDGGQEFGHAITSDSNANVFLTGHLYGTLDFGTGAIHREDGAGFVAALDPSGKGLWSKSFGQYSGVGHGIAVHGCDEVILTGTFYGELDLGGEEPLEGEYEALFVARLDGNGNHLWSLVGAEDADAFSHAVAVDAEGNVIVVGAARGDVDFGGGVLPAMGAYDIFAAKLDPSGKHLWSKRFGDGDKSQFVSRIAVDPSGGIWITGAFGGSIDFGGGPLSAVEGTVDAPYQQFVAKLDASGNHVFSASYGLWTSGSGGALATDSAGNAFFAGGFKDSIDLGGGALTSAGNSDVFVAKLDPSGAHVWSKRFGDGMGQAISHIAVDANDQLVVSGNSAGTLDFGGGAAPLSGGSGMFIAALDGKGVGLWSRGVVTSLPASLSGMGLDPSGQILLTGDFYDELDFGGGPLQATEDYLIPNLFGPDLFIAKLAP